MNLPCVKDKEHIVSCVRPFGCLCNETQHNAFEACHKVHSSNSFCLGSFIIAGIVPPEERKKSAWFLCLTQQTINTPITLEKNTPQATKQSNTSQDNAMILHISIHSSLTYITCLILQTGHILKVLTFLAVIEAGSATLSSAICVCFTLRLCTQCDTKPWLGANSAPHQGKPCWWPAFDSPPTEVKSLCSIWG